MVNEDDPVGYRRPPVHSRFAKGVSGNPSGRKKAKTPTLHEAATEVFSKPIVGRRNGRRVSVPPAKLQYRNLCRRALKGEKAALKRVIELMQTLRPDPAFKKRTPEEERAIYERFMKGLQKWL